MKIGELARQIGVNIQTVRYYERIGLLHPDRRLESGYREYGKQAVDKLHFIKRAQQLGFTLKEVDELLSLRVDPDTTCNEVHERAVHKITDIERKIADLQRMKLGLEKLAAQCSGIGPTSECPILDALEG